MHEHADRKRQTVTICIIASSMADFIFFQIKSAIFLLFARCARLAAGIRRQFQSDKVSLIVLTDRTGLRCLGSFLNMTAV